MPWYLDGGVLTIVVVFICLMARAILDPELDEDGKAFRDGFHIYSTPEDNAGGGEP